MQETAQTYNRFLKALSAGPVERGELMVQVLGPKAKKSLFFYYLGGFRKMLETTGDQRLINYNTARALPGVYGLVSADSPLGEAQESFRTTLKKRTRANNPPIIPSATESASIQERNYSQSREYVLSGQEKFQENRRKSLAEQKGLEVAKVLIRTLRNMGSLDHITGDPVEFMADIIDEDRDFTLLFPGQAPSKEVQARSFILKSIDAVCFEGLSQRSALGGQRQSVLDSWNELRRKPGENWPKLRVILKVFAHFSPDRPAVGSVQTEPLAST